MTTSYRVQDSTNIHKCHVTCIYWDFWLQKGGNSASASWNIEVNLWIMLQENSEIDMTSGKLSLSPAGQEIKTSTQFLSLKILALLCQCWVHFFHQALTLWSQRWILTTLELLSSGSFSSRKVGVCLPNYSNQFWEWRLFAPIGIFSSIQQSLGQGDEIYWLAYTNQDLPLELLEEGSDPLKLYNWEIQGITRKKEEIIEKEATHVHYNTKSKLTELGILSK